MSFSICLVYWIYCHVSRNFDLLTSVLLFVTYVDKKVSIELKGLCLSTEFKTSLFSNYDAPVQDQEGYLISIKAKHFLSTGF